jgi:predicted AAA+ superfamily ATPase
MDLALLSVQNPWWAGAAALSTDAHLERFDASSVKLDHGAFRRLRTDTTGVYLLRGPRQVGKTTLLKRKVRELVEQGVPAADVMFLALDIAGIGTHTDLAAAIRLFVEWRPDSARRFVFLDEVTYCPEWSLGVKAAFDMGLLRGCLVVCTGSHTLDLLKGTERLAGRRGAVEADSDVEMAPYPFGEVARIFDRDATPAVSPTWRPRDVFAAAQENAPRFRKSAEAFRTFLLAGGMPRAIGETIAGGRFSRETAAVYRDSVIGDLMRAGKKEPFIRDLVRAVVEIQGSPVDWHGLAERVSIASKTTVADYMEAMKACYLLTVLPQPKTLGSRVAAPRKPRKVHFRDPFLAHVFTAWASGVPDPWETASACIADPAKTGMLVEAAVAGQLQPSFRQVMHWRNHAEIDIVAIAHDSSQVLLEVKYQSAITSGDVRALKRHGGGILVSRDTLSLDTDKGIAVVPAPLLLLSVPGPV